MTARLLAAIAALCAGQRPYLPCPGCGRDAQETRAVISNYDGTHRYTCLACTTVWALTPADEIAQWTYWLTE